VTSVTDGAQDKTSYSYDGLGRKTKVTYPDGTAATTGYDPAGNVTSTASLDASGTTLATTAAAFNGEGDQLSATDAAGNSTTFTYDPTGLVTGEVQPVSASSGITTSFGYDAAGKQTLYTDPNGNPWWDTYNSWGLQESRVEPYTTAYTSAANSTFTTAYDAGGRPVTETEPGGVTVTDTYNSLSELTGQSAAGADAATPARTFGYDTAGNLTSASTSNTLGSGSNATSEAFTYNDRGQVLTASGSAGSTSYAYNGDGQVASVADAAGTTSYTYDGAGRLATLADPATGTTATYSYNPDSQVSQVSYGSGKDTQSFGYDARHQLTSDTLKTSAGATVASVSYGYNADSEVTSQTTTGLAGSASSTYTYDQAGRLTSWNNGTATTQYGYDPSGNLTQDGAKTYTYDARDELTNDGTASYSYTARGTPSSESGPSGTIAVTFDAYGDQATAGTRSYTYDALGRLTADTPTAGGSGYQFSYAGSTGTIASDGSSAYTWDPSGSTLIAAGSPGGGTSGALALANVHGDVLGQFTASGTAVSGSQSYDPWGTVTATTGTPAGLLGYQSAWSDPASGKDLMGARWYAPTAGDFTSADTVQVSPDPDPAAGNPFAYAADEPLDLTDPTGHMSLGSLVTSVVKKAVPVTTVVKKPVPVAKAVLTAAKKAVPVTTVVKKPAPAVQRKATTALKPADKPVLSKQFEDSSFGSLGTAINVGARASQTQKWNNASNAANKLALETIGIPIVDAGTAIAAGVVQGLKGVNAIRNGNTAGGIADIASGILAGAGGKILGGISKLAGKAAAPVVRAVASNGPSISKQDIQGLFGQARALYEARGVENSTVGVARVWNQATKKVETWVSTEDPLLPATIKNNMGNAVYKFGDGHAEDTIVGSLGKGYILLGIASSSRICESCYTSLSGVPGMIETRVGQSVPGDGVTEWRTMVNQGYVGS